MVIHVNICDIGICWWYWGFGSRPPQWSESHQVLISQCSLKICSHYIVVVQSLNHVWLFVTSCTGLTAQCSFVLHRLICPPLSPRVCSNSCPLRQWCYLTISSSSAPFSFWLQSFPASGSFPASWLFTSGSQNIEASVSASVLLMNIQGWFPLELTGLLMLK